VIFNKSNEAKPVKVSNHIFGNKEYISHFGSSVESDPDSVTIELEPLSFDIITNKN
jgi:hypothetical protein